MTKKTKKYKVYADPGHAWLKVKRDELKKLGINDQISRFSYQRKDHVYLEEDIDAGIFIEAIKAKGIEPVFDTHHTSNRSKIRSYNLYWNYESTRS